jgi:predicted aspartyl protease
MANEITVHANRYDEYWVAVRVNGLVLQAQIDTAMTQAECEIGLSLTAADFDRLAPTLAQQWTVERYDVGSPTPVAIPTGIGRVSLYGLDGSEIETHIARLGTNLLGVCYFHRLVGFEMNWDFASRTMVIRRSL